MQLSIGSSKISALRWDGEKGNGVEALNGRGGKGGSENGSQTKCVQRTSSIIKLITSNLQLIITEYSVLIIGNVACFCRI